MSHEAFSLRRFLGMMHSESKWPGFSFPDACVEPRLGDLADESEVAARILVFLQVFCLLHSGFMRPCFYSLRSLHQAMAWCVVDESEVVV